MSAMKKFAAASMGTIALVLASTLSAVAASGDFCGGDVSVGGGITGLVDPFNPSVTSVSGSITVSRAAAAQGGGKTQDYAFYIAPQTNSPLLPAGTHIMFNNADILNNSTPYGTPTPSTPAPSNNDLSLPGGGLAAYTASSPSDYLVVGFSGASQPDTQTATLNFTLSALGYLPAGTTQIHFDVYYVCKATGGYTAVTTPRKADHSDLILNVTALSALQANLNGTALDFGELGTDQTGGVQAATSPGTFVAVKSNAAYEVSLKSANGFLLHSDGSTGNTQAPGNNNIKYNVDFLGARLGYGGTLTGPDVATDIGSCSSTVFAIRNMGITAHTAEPGQGKQPSTGYRDTLTVTLAPKIANYSPTITNCN